MNITITTSAITTVTIITIISLNMLNGSVAFLDPQVGLPQVLLFVGSPKLVFLRSVDFSKHTIVCTKAYYSMHDDMIRKHIKGGILGSPRATRRP